MTIAKLVERLRLLSRRNPVVFLFEDAQWSDPSTQDFLAAVIDSVSSAPVPDSDHRTAGVQIPLARSR